MDKYLVPLETVRLTIRCSRALAALRLLRCKLTALFQFSTKCSHVCIWTRTF
jgi:hypothetical protein